MEFEGGGAQTRTQCTDFITHTFIRSPAATITTTTTINLLTYVRAHTHTYTHSKKGRRTGTNTQHTDNAKCSY